MSPHTRTRALFSAHPENSGLYRREFEHDACGVALIATMRGTAGHDIVDHALTALRNLDHRGATGADPLVGDGAGILTQIPDEFFRASVPFTLPNNGAYAAGIAFLPQNAIERAAAKARIEEIAVAENLKVLGWREVPVEADLVGTVARDCMPFFEQLFVSSSIGRQVALGLDRLAFCLRKRAEHEVDVYFASLSSRTIVYKGMLTTGQLEPFFPDLSDPRYATELALVHSRFSTNTFPSWPLAHPYRLIAHNGEINTVKGNRNWMHARESLLTSDIIPGDLERLFPICTPEASDSASFDEVLELLHLGGRSLPHAVLMMIPEAWENHATMDPARKAFYEFHSTFMEPWDGPANVCFSDGTLVGAVLDRNGLRPGRYTVTDDGLVVLASESGVLELDPRTIVQRGRLQPGKMFLVDTEHGRIVSDEEIKSQLAAAKPYAEWLHAGLIRLEDLPEREHIVHTAASVARRQQTFGYTAEELRILLTPMARSGGEALGSMGTDTPIAVLSSRPRLLFDYFTQLFAQVTNPPARRDPRGARHLARHLHGAGGQRPVGVAGARPPARARLPGHRQRRARQDRARQRRRRPARLRHARRARPLRRHRRRGRHARPARGDLRRGLAGDLARRALRRALRPRLGPRPRARSRRCCSPRRSTTTSSARRPAPRSACSSRRATSARCTTSRCSSATARPRSTRTSPWRPSRTSSAPARSRASRAEKAVANLIKALGKGVLKVMSKMGISTVASYRGAQVFEAIGLSQALVDRYFTGTVSPARRRRPRRHRPRGGRAPRPGLPAGRRAPAAPRARGRRRVPVASRGRAAPLRPRDGLPPPALDAPAPLRHLQAVHRARRRPDRRVS